MSRVWLAVVLVLAACSSGTRRVGGKPSWRSTSAATKPVGPVTFAPTSEPATHYNEPLQAPAPSPLGDAVLAAVKRAATKANLAVPVADARLFRACAELAELMPDEDIIAYSVVEFVLQRHGIIEPLVHRYVMWGDVDEPEKLVAELEPQFAEILADGAHARIGVGAAKRRPDGTSAIVFAMQPSDIATSPIPRAVPAGGSFAIDGVMANKYREPELFVTREDGSTEHIDVTIGRSGAIKASVSCGKHIGKQQVEITASDARGSQVLANFPVWCGAEPPRSVEIEPTHPDDQIVVADEAERRLLALINRDRKAAGLAPLQWDDRVAAVSRAHSEEMMRTKIVAHVSPTTGAAADRVRAAGIKTALVLENVARAYGVGEAHAGLMNSPGHRANLLAPHATHVGIGVILGDEVSGRRALFLTQVFTRVPPKVDRAEAAELVRKRIHTLRPVVANAGLASVAQYIADGLASGKSRDALWPTAKKRLATMNGPYARFGTVAIAVADLEVSVDGKDLLSDYKADDIGVGIAQGEHPEIGEGAIWIVVLLAERLPNKK